MRNPRLRLRRLCYIRQVKTTAYITLILLALITVSCNKSINVQVADAVRQFDDLNLTEKEIKVLSTQEMGDHAIAEVEVRTALKLTRRGGRWQIDEVRIGDRRWEKADHIRAVLNEERRKTTTVQLQKVSAGVRRYFEEQGKTPAVADFRALMAILTPGYMAEPYAEDAWAVPFEYRRLGTNGFELRSAGPDRQLGTVDDLVERNDK